MSDTKDTSAPLSPVEMVSALTAMKAQPQTLPSHHSLLHQIIDFLLKIAPVVETILNIPHGSAQTSAAAAGVPLKMDPESPLVAPEAGAVQNENTEGRV